MAMTCVEFLKRLDADEPLDADADARAHAETCAGCRAALDRWSAAQDQLRAWSEEEPPPFLHARLMAHVRAAAQDAERAHAARGVWWRRLAWAGPALAIVFVGVIGGITFLRAPWVAHPTRARSTPQSLEAEKSGAGEVAAPPLERAPAAPEAPAEVVPAPPAARAPAARAPAASIPSPRAKLSEPRGRTYGYAPDVEEERPAEGAAGGVAGGFADRQAFGRLEERDAAEAQAETETQRRTDELRLRQEGAAKAARAQARAEPREATLKQKDEAPGLAPAPSAAAAPPATPRPAAPHKKDDETLEALRALGYIDDTPEAAPARVVRCRVVPLDGGRPRLVTLAADAAPAAEHALLVEVRDDGEVLLRGEAPPPSGAAPSRVSAQASRARASDAHEKDTTSESQARRDKGTGARPMADEAPAAALRALGLPPGRYRLERVP